MDIRSDRKRPSREGMTEKCGGVARARCGKKRGPDAGLSFPEGLAHLHLSDVFLGRAYDLR